MKKLNEVIVFKFYTKEDAEGFLARRIQNHGNTEADLNLYEVEGFGWAVEVAV